MTDEDRDRPDLYEVLEHYGWEPPSPRPGWVSVKCQVHGETRASCRINYDLGAIKCMACDFKGDVYTLIMHHEDVGFRQALTIGANFDTDTHRPAGRGRHTTRRTQPTRGYVPPRLRGQKP